MGAKVWMEEWLVWCECCGGVGVGKGLCFALTAASSVCVQGTVWARKEWSTCHVSSASWSGCSRSTSKVRMVGGEPVMRSDEGMDVVVMLRSGCKRVLVSVGGCRRRVWKRAVSGCVGAEGMCGLGEGAGMGWDRCGWWMLCGDVQE